MRVVFLVALLAATACSTEPGDYCDTPGVCTYPDGMVPDVKKDASDAGVKDGASSDAPTADVAAD